MGSKEINSSNIRSLPKPSFIADLVVETEVSIPGIETRCYLLDFCQDEDALDAWALHIRRHYVRDDALKKNCAFRDVTTEEYLKEHVIPQTPRMRGGDFAEIVISDLIQFVEGYVVPRYKQNRRKDPEASEHGTDVLAYKIGNVDSPSPNDELLLVEVKSAAGSPLKEAFKSVGADCGKDLSRAAMTMSYYLDECLEVGDFETANELKRLMNKGENTYKTTLAAASAAGIGDVSGHLCGETADTLGVSGYDHVYILHKVRLMDLAHSLYDRCTL